MGGWAGGGGGECVRTILLSEYQSRRFFYGDVWLLTFDQKQEKPVSSSPKRGKNLCSSGQVVQRSTRKNCLVRCVLDVILTLKRNLEFACNHRNSEYGTLILYQLQSKVQ